MTLRHCFALAALTLSSLSLAHAADLAGHWTSEFDSQIGVQKYTYDFKAGGDKLTGKATYDHSLGKGETVLKEIKVTGDDVFFAEDFSAPDVSVHITYTGKIAGDEMKLTRQVGDLATEQIVAKRVKAEAQKPETKPAPAK
jgi:hypothetical protein